jgi:hypothetical protein
MGSITSLVASKDHLMTSKKKKIYREYRDGVIDGMRIALKLTAGQEVSGGVPYRGLRSPNLDRWLELTLKQLEDVEDESHE